MAQKMTHIAKAVAASDNKAAYDAQAKKLLSDKNILAWILKYTAREFRDFEIPQIKEFIEGVPEVGTVPVSPGLRKEAILGLNTESKIPGEGEVFFDIRFSACIPGSEPIRVFVNVEMQNKYNVGYSIAARGVFYCARMLSEQLDTEFTSSDYDKIKKVYSIWICADPPKYAQNTITEYKLGANKILGDFAGKGKYDLLSVVVVGLPKEEKDCVDNGLIRLLHTLFSRKSPDKKLEQLEKEFKIPCSIIEKEVFDLCNLSDLLIEQGIEQGSEQTAWKIFIDLIRENILSVSDVAERLGVDAETVRDKMAQY